MKVTALSQSDLSVLQRSARLAAVTGRASAAAITAASVATAARTVSGLVIKLDTRPAVAGQRFHRLEAGLVGHLLAALDPIAEIDVRDAAAFRVADVVEDHVGAETACILARMEEAVDHRHAVAQHIGQGAGDERARAAVIGRAAIFDDLRVDRRFLDHRVFVEQAHVGHAAAGVTGIQIGAQERELLAGGLGNDFAAHQIGVAAVDALEVPGRLELVNKDADADAGVAALAGRAVGYGLAAAEAGMRQGLAERLGVTAGQTREDLPLDAPREVGAGAAGRQEKLRYAGVMLFGQRANPNFRP